MGKRRYTTKETRMDLYAASQYLSTSTEEELGIRIRFDVYLQDPYVAKNDPKYGIDDKFFVDWEPGISDGPTSARFVVVDFNGDTETLLPKAKWNATDEAFYDTKKKKLDKTNKSSLQFHQVNVWAILQKALRFFEESRGLGRRIPFGFEGNRLIVVPHAGYGENAFYDRYSKSLQFYYFDRDGERIYTCLSTDIINHEFGHAVLDGIRPYYFESSLVQTGAFHEFIGDLTAMLIILRNNKFRAQLAIETKGNLSVNTHLSNIAEQFGKAVSDKDYLRSGLNQLTMADVKDADGPHEMSQVLTGAMFDILQELTGRYIKEGGRTVRQSFAHAIERMQRMSIQPLDLLPPVDVTFSDYARAVLRAEELSNPTDPYKYYDMMLTVFVKRGILTKEEQEKLLEPRYIYDRQNLAVYHDIDNISRSRAGAYRFLDDNRNKLFIPYNQDLVVADLYDANKFTTAAGRMPKQIILEYIWREDVVLEGKQFGKYNGEATTMLCGGTMVFDEQGNVLSWFRKPGSVGGTGKYWDAENADGAARLKQMLTDLAIRIKTGQVGSALGSAKGMLGSMIPPLTVRKENGILKFELSPHLNLSGEDHEHYKGGPKWEISS